jgi:hypothetical protein
MTVRPFGESSASARTQFCFSSEDIHRALFGAQKPETRTVQELKAGIRRYARVARSPAVGLQDPEAVTAAPQLFRAKTSPGFF